MMSPSVVASSNIRAFVKWKDPTVYGGEEIECIITFKNIAIPSGQERDNEAQRPNDSFMGVGAAAAAGSRRQSTVGPSSAAGSRRASIAQNLSQMSQAPLSKRQGSYSGTGKGHRPALSLNVVTAPVRGGMTSAPLLSSQTPITARPVPPRHGRSLSIMSLGSEVPSDSQTATSSQPASRGHWRSASMQLVPRSASTKRTSPNPNQTFQFPRQPSPLNEAITPPELPGGQDPNLALRPGRRRPGTATAGNTPVLGRQKSVRKQTGNESLDADFQFPLRQQTSPKKTSTATFERPAKPTRTPSTMHSGQMRPSSPRPPEGWSGEGSTPRSSSEFYSMPSNQSDETLTSELHNQNQVMGRLLPRTLHSRSASRRNSPGGFAEPETLTLAYAQTLGHFTLDSSLVNSAPFEEVKRRGAQSSGGVVGVERSKSKRASGMFGGFSWGSINESLGGLLGVDENSTLAQMNKAVGSKSIPLLSTPQSLLFADLTLAPGQSKSYLYRFHLPRGLPPSHEKGRAIKVQYRLSIAVQRSDSGGQTVKTVEIPFRVLGSVNARGQSLGHDLMSPYILLRDAARTKSIASMRGESTADLFRYSAEAEKSRSETPKQGLEDFLRYTERLLEDTTKDERDALASPTTPLPHTQSRKESASESSVPSVKEAIDLAILRSNYNGTPSNNDTHTTDTRATNRFNIARSGQPVAVLTLLRPAYRLGESVIGTFDFSAPFNALPNHPPPAAQPASTYAILIELESAESVDPSLALRSSSSIQRVTRRVHASVRLNALFARQLSFNLAVPTTSTPTFETTGVNFGWRLRVEFITQRHDSVDLRGVDESGESGEELLEEIGRDERGMGLIAKEKLMADSFEVGIPIRVFGAGGTEDMQYSESLEV
ncbi:Rgp1-domain-containing protein [Polychaeton citri CBS 116435]|uniref:Rgp1-domain-containing protein n=1 Tax=Polychaeton citri CBS 116435 TaxID=1314669 RepID=A0A9P4QCX1_9PEZI|nr:Rgp1-domain-containing protein [Polychaeton citri CBS 116435]